MITISNVTSNQTFGTWYTRVNQMAVLFSQNTLTSDSSTNGSLTTGNTYVNGIFGTLNLTVSGNVSGGTLTTPANLTIQTNTLFWNGAFNVFSVLSNSTTSNVNILANTIYVPNTTKLVGNLTFSFGIQLLQ